MSRNWRTDLRNPLYQLRNLFFTKQSNHRTLTVLFYIFDISYYNGTALPFVAAESLKSVKIEVLISKF